MQGGPLYIVVYGIRVLPVIKQMKAEHLYVTQPWYAYYTGELGTYGNIELYFNFLKKSGPGRGYYPKPSKIVLIVHPDNIKTIKQFG